MATVGAIRTRLRKVVLLAISPRMNTTLDGWIFIIVTDGKAKACGINVAVAPEEESPKDWLGKDIKNPIEYSFRVRCDDVAALAKAPRNRIQKPEKNGQAAADKVGPRDVRAKCGCVLASSPSDGPRNDEECGAAKDVISPLFDSTSVAALPVTKYILKQD